MARPVIEVTYAQIAFVALIALALALNSGTQQFAASFITGLATTANPATTATITNAAPALTNCSISSSVTLTADGNVSVFCNCSVTDANGYSDIHSVNGTLFNHTTSATGAADNYKRVFNNSCTKNHGSGNYLAANCTFNLPYYAAPGNWRCNLMANDTSGNVLNITGDPTKSYDNMSVAGLVGITVDTSTIAYGSISAGANGSAITVKVNNVGNVQVDAKFEGTNLTNSSALGAGVPASFLNFSRQWYSFNSDFLPASNNYKLGNSTFASVSFNASYNLAPAQSAPVVNMTQYFKLEVPDGQASGSYSGTVLVTAQEG